MRVLVACEFSGVVRQAFRAQGHDAWSCDLLPTLIPGQHIQGDVLGVLAQGWDLMIAHPPCTYLLNSGVRWLTQIPARPKPGVLYGPERVVAMKKAVLFFVALLNAPINKICVENPTTTYHAGLPPYTQAIQPWQFGHGELKRTCLWLHNLPELKPTNIVTGREQRIWKMSPSKDRGQLRSITYPGIAAAMAQQWS